jgi:iron complex outermembrane receptor protein
MLVAVSAGAQNKVKGRIIDSKSKTPLVGASIKIAGKPSVVSDSLGNFVLDCNSNSLVTVSFIGYASSQKTVIDCNTALIFSLEQTHQQLEKVEITATSNQNKSTLYQPVSIAKLTDVELKRNTGLYLDDAINSNVPGVTMQRRAVSSGQQFNIRGYGNGLRGTNGINSNFDGQGSKVYKWNSDYRC